MVLACSPFSVWRHSSRAAAGRMVGRRTARTRTTRAAVTAAI